MHTHVRVLGAVYVALGAIGLVATVVLAVIFGGLAGVANASALGDTLGFRLGALASVVIILAAIVLSVPAIIVGWGLLRFRPWAWVAGLLLTVLMLVHFPFGTLVAVYGFFILLNDEVARLFGRTSVAAR